MTIEDRLEKLEKELSRAKGRNRWLLVSLCLGIGLLAGVCWSGAASTQPARAALKVVRANEFILEDENGKNRAQLGVDKNGSVLSLYGENGKKRAELGVVKAGAGLVLADEKGKVLWSAP